MDLYSLLALTAWKMRMPVPYGFVHLSFFFGGLVLAVLLAWRWRRADEKLLGRILFVCGLTLLLLEVYKQLFLTFYVNDGVFQWSNFPFHLCSMPMYLCLIFPWLKSRRLKKMLWTFMATYNFLGGFLSFIEPSGLLHEYWTLTYHALLWHMLLVFIGLLLMFNEHVYFDRCGFKDAVCLFIMLAVVAYLINIDVLYFTSQQTNMFFVGPLSSPLVVFGAICERFGWFVNLLVYGFVLTLGAFLVYLLIRFFAGRRYIELFR